MTKRTIITNAHIWTSDRDDPWAEAIVIQGKNIVYVGDAEQADTFSDKDTMIINGGNKMIIPALIDSHTHLTSVAKSKWCFLLEQRDYQSVEEIMEIVKAYADKTPRIERPYIYAYSCPTELLDRENVNRYLMDQYISDRPVLLCDSNFHRCLVNSKMLELMEVDENTPYNESSSANYARFDNNVPNGFVYEHAYEFNKDIDKMFEKLNWQPPSESDPDVVLPVLDAFTNWGVCGICDGFTESEGTLQCIKKLEQAGNLNHYYYGMPLMKDFACLEDAIRTAKEWQHKYEDEYIKINAIKFFLDGTNEIGTSAVLEPFENDPEGKNCGVMNMTEGELTTVFCRLNQEGLNIQIHLVGDRAFRTALNASQRAQKLEKRDGRDFLSKIWLIHCELTKPEDRDRVAKLGVYINFTPIWAGNAFEDAAMECLGKERFDSMYAFNRMIETGAIVNFSSDVVDNEDFNYASPFKGMEAGYTRKLPHIKKVRQPESEKLSLENLLLGYTINNAIALGDDKRIGSLEAGKRANLCILNQNIFEAPEDKIGDILPEVVMFEGKIIKGELK